MSDEQLLKAASVWLIERHRAASKLERDNARYSAAVMTDRWGDFIRELLEEAKS